MIPKFMFTPLFSAVSCRLKNPTAYSMTPLRYLAVVLNLAWPFQPDGSSHLPSALNPSTLPLFFTILSQ